MDATFANYPPPWNPDYERERDDYSIYALEHELAHAQDMADCHEQRAGELYGEGHIDDADYHLNLMDAANRHATEIRQRLIELDGGF